MARGRWAWVASGDGWRGAGPVPADGAWGVRDAAVVERLALRLAGDGSEADADAAKAALATVDAWGRRGLGVAGSWSFELGAALERVPVTQASQRSQAGPQRFARFDDVVAVAFDPGSVETLAAVAAAAPRRPEAPAAADLPSDALAPPASWRRHRGGFLAEAATIGGEIADGRVYQVNLTRALPVDRRQGRAAFRAAAPDVLAALQQSQPVPFAAVLEARSAGRPPQRLISGSMELFLGVDPGPPGVVRSRPIKGTAARDPDAARDAAAGLGLQGSPKERAENAMIVDMARNDLGRIAVQGSVHVPALLQAVPYQTLWHLESEVHATPRPGVRVASLLEATMPPASVSGAPKIAAIRTIVALERRRRGPYCGALGVVWPDGSARLAVAIRVVLADASGAELAVGAGIVADSSPEAEWQELLLKASASRRWLATLAAHSQRQPRRRRA